jgi:hemerythrin-like domain-containing protein
MPTCGVRTTRRETLLGGTVLFAAGCSLVGGARGPKERPGDEVSPTEDLMREHGVLERVLLIYDEQERRLRAGDEFEPDAVASAARIVRRFIEDYHERLEEEHVFPRAEKIGKLGELVAVLRLQHQRGRRLTDDVARLATRKALASAGDRAALATSLHAYAQMFRPHAAREDTVLFPAYHGALTAQELTALGAAFEERERQVLGPRGFEAVVDEVARLEREVRIYDLARVTPP